MGLSPLESLFLVLAAIYFFDCVVRLRDGSIGVASWLGEPRRLVRSGLFSGPGQTGLTLSSPLPWPGWFLAEPFPVAISPQCVASRTPFALGPFGREATPHPARLWDWDELGGDRIIQDDKDIRIGKTTVARMGSRAHARAAVAALRRLAAAPASQREALIDAELTAATDLESARRRRDHIRKVSSTARSAESTLLLLLFVYAPAFFLWIQPGRPGGYGGIAFGLLFVVFWVVSVVAAYRAHRRIDPDDIRGRRSFTLMMSVSPLDAIRGFDHLSRVAFAGFDPLAVVGAIGGAGAIRSLAESCLRDARHPGRRPESDVETWYRARMLREWERLTRELGLDPDALDVPPEREDESSLAFCPRCREQYTRSEGDCESCGAVPLVTWPPAPA